MKRILFTGGGGAGNEAIWRALGDCYELFFADAMPDAISPQIPEERRLSIPMANEPNFASRLLKVATQYQIDLIVPGVDEELELLSLRKTDLAWPRILLPSHGFVSRMLDKLESARAVIDAGLAGPKTVSADQASELSFPLILKPRKGRGSRGVMRLDHPNQVAAYLALYQTTSDSVVAQELLSGQEYTVFVCADENAGLHAVVPVRVGLKRGITIRAETEANQAVIQYAQAFQEKFKATGVYNIQCMLDADGKVMPFEVNPRVSTTFCLAISCGFDPFEMLFGSGANPRELFVPCDNVRLSRSWTNTITLIDTSKGK